MTEHESSNHGWWCDGEAQQTLDKLAAAGIIDVQGALLDDASEDARDRNYFDQEQEGIGEGARLVFVTHRAREADVQACVSEFRKSPAVKRASGLIRVIGE